jgi:hypothetical protein
MINMVDKSGLRVIREVSNSVTSMRWAALVEIDANYLGSVV